jgi:hypothetical protein
MIDASQWAKRLRMARSESIARDPEVETGFVRRAEGVVRDSQLDTINQCLRIAHQLMNQAPRLQRIGIGKVVDALSDLAIDVKRRGAPKQGGG